MSLLYIAARVASSMSQPLSDRPDYGTRQMVSQEEQECQETVGQEKESIIRKTPGKGYCVKSENNPDWSGGCFPSKGEAKKRLKQIEFFKHKSSLSTSMDEAHDSVSKTVSQSTSVSGFDEVIENEDMVMKKPTEISASIRQIANRIDRSNSPVKDLVISDVRRVLAAVEGSSKVTIKEFEWDPGDKRSFGNFKIVADTSLGELVGHGMIGSGSDTENEIWTLDGNPISNEVDYPDLGMPHYYAGNRAMARFEKIKDVEIPEILSEWISKYPGLVQE